MNYQALVTNMSGNPERLAVYNKFADKKVSKFSDTRTAIRRTAEILELKNVQLKDISNDLSDETKEKIKDLPPQRETNFPGPSWKYDDKRLYKTVKENPRRKDTHGYKTFELIVDGMLGKELRARGGRAKDVNWDIKHGNVEVR